MDVLSEFFDAQAALPAWVSRSGRAVMVKLDTLKSLEAFWTTHGRRLQFVISRGSGVTDSELLDRCEWVFAKTPEDAVKAVCRWDQSDIRAEWLPWAEDSVFNATLAILSPGKLERRGWWVLNNFPEPGDAFCWEGAEEGMIHDPTVTHEHMEHQFQLELFDAWREDGQELRAFTAGDLEAHIATMRLDRWGAIDYHYRQAGPPVFS